MGAFGVIVSLGYLAVAQDSEAVRSLARFSEQGLVDPENWENIVETQLYEWWSNPYVLA